MADAAIVPIPAEAHDLLHDKPTGHVATIRPSGQLSVNPVALLFEDGVVKFSTTKDRAKFRNLVNDQRVAMSIPHRNNPNVYIEVRGTAVLEDDDDRAFINRIAQHYMDKDVYPFDPPGTERVTITIRTERVSMPAIPLADDPPAKPDQVS